MRECGLEHGVRALNSKSVGLWDSGSGAAGPWACQKVGDSQGSLMFLYGDRVTCKKSRILTLNPIRP